MGYAEAKGLLADVIERELGPARDRFFELRADEAELRRVLATGACHARTVAVQTMSQVRQSIGIEQLPSE
jgi:tryptophanyl-tRNA synthetase